jgi:hypothetical protein
MDDQLFKLLESLKLQLSGLNSKKIVTGFDGFIDSIQKVILTQNHGKGVEYFKTMEDFGVYVTRKKAGGISLEAVETVKKLGGNAPIMANAVAQFAVNTHCIGAFGYPEIDPVFADMQTNTSLHSFANPGFTSALEFSDGKIMLAQMADLNGATWELIKERIGLDQIIKIIENTDILCLLNWSEVRHTTEIWEGLLKEVFPAINQERRMKVFFDLSDCSKHDTDQIRKSLDLLQRFSVDCDVTLSLNKNEAAIVYQVLKSSPVDDLDILGSGIFEFLNIHTLVIHTSGKSLAWKGLDRYQADTSFLKNPAISTGAGDNFNAGFCIGQLLEPKTDQTLLLANLLAACYMKNGYSPGLSELLNFGKEV